MVQIDVVNGEHPTFLEVVYKVLEHPGFIAVLRVKSKYDVIFTKFVCVDFIELLKHLVDLSHFHSPVW